METYNRPITPPDNDRLKDSTLPEVQPLQKKQEQVLPLTDSVPTHVNTSNPFAAENNVLRSSQPPPAADDSRRRSSQPPPGYTQGAAFPFEKSSLGFSPTSATTDRGSEGLSQPQTLSATLQEPLISSKQEIPSAPPPRQAATRSSVDASHVQPHIGTRENPKVVHQDTSARYGSSQRNDTTHRIETETLNILQWKNPMRSGAVLAMIVGSILLTRWYSLLQLGAMALSLSIGINLIYVHFMLQGQKVLSQDHVNHPYRDVIHNEKATAIDRQSVRHFTNMFIEVAETVIRGLTRIVFIDDTKTSLKWLAMSFFVWKVSAHMSAVNLILMVTLSAFTFPRLYISNKDLVDAHLQKGQHLVQHGINRAQEAARDGIQDTYAKARSMAAKSGTTGTDAKNTMNKSSITVKQD
ncbi:hypothetical protein G6F43_005892 [Rhizopus delemar]|nr:hypothetical protein G6F43_005892 [Rhizopus delemar]